MARPKLSQDVNSASVSGETESGINLDQNELLKMIQGLQEEVKKLKKNTVIETPIQGNYGDDENEFENVKIHPEKYVKVISLDVYPLNLSTEGRGKGRIFRFNEFGDTKRIMYKYLIDIVENQQNFLKSGKFYILNRAAIYELGLEDDYSNLLTKENIEAILSGNDRDVTISLFKSANKAQQEVIIQMLIERRVGGQNVDMNIWDQIRRLTNIDMDKKYNDVVDLMDVMKKKEQDELQGK